jgi:FkbM family methyltransferase
MTDAFDVFLAADASAINRARLEHLVNLGLDLAGKRVLEVGAGIGLLSHPFEERGCALLSTDGSARNIIEMRRRFPHRDCAVLDVDSPCDLSALGTFDVVFCYGTLYHLANPDRALKQLAAVCTGQILLETIVLPGEASDLQLVRDPMAANQAIAGVGCRPTRAWVMDALRRHLGHAYATVDQPDFPDYVTDWSLIGHAGNVRAVFVGSRTALQNAKLVETPPRRQDPCSSAVSRPPSQLWIDAGTDDREDSLTWVSRGDVFVHAFEPSSRKAAALAERAPANYVVHAKAVGLSNGMAAVTVGSPADTGSTPGICDDPPADLSAETVQMTRLDSFLHEIGAARVERLKLDAFDGDFDALRSLGERIQHVHHLQVAVFGGELGSRGAATSTAEMIAWLEGQGFELADSGPQSHGQKAQLTFTRRDWSYEPPPETAPAERLYDFGDAAIERGQAHRDGEALWVETGPESWSYAVVVPPRPQPDLVGRRMKLKLRADVDSGRAQIGILEPDGARFVTSRIVSQGDDGVFWLDVPQSAPPGALVIRAADDGRATLTVQLLEMWMSSAAPSGAS